MTNAAGPWATLRRRLGTVEIWVGKDHQMHRVVSPNGVDEEVYGHDAATKRAHQLADELE